MKLHIPPALKHRRFLLLWAGMIISVAGSRMQFTALLWHISVLTPEPIYLGLVGLVRVAPVFVLSLVAGAAADTFDRRKILFISQTVETLCALTLGLLTLTGNIQLWHLYALTFVEASAAAFDLPARQSITPNIVPAHDLPNAFSMQSIAFTVASIAGPVLSGIVLATAWLGQPYVYLFNAVSFLALIFAVFAIGPVPQEHEPGERRGVSLGAIRDGVAFIRHQPIILSSMVLDFIATFFSSATALLPLYARLILNVAEVGYGWLTAAQAVGAAVAAAVISQMQSIRRQGPILLASVAIYGLATILFGLSTSFGLAFIALMLVGAGDSVSTIIRNTIRQLQTPDRMRGRMTGINQLFFIGGPQLGEFEAGVVAQLFGPVVAVVTGGIGCIVGAFLVMRHWPELAHYDQYENRAP